MLELRVIPPRLLVIFSGSFTSQIETELTLHEYPIHEGYTVPNVEIAVLLQAELFFAGSLSGIPPNTSW